MSRVPIYSAMKKFLTIFPEFPDVNLADVQTILKLFFVFVVFFLCSNITMNDPSSCIQALNYFLTNQILDFFEALNHVFCQIPNCSQVS